MNIAHVEPLAMRWPRGGRSAFIRITAEDGTFGLGEASPMYDGRASLSIITDLAQHLVGADPLDSGVIQDTLFHRAIKLGPDGVLAGALAAIDIALWDLKGKLLGKPIYKLLGGAWRTELPFYASIGGNGVRGVEEVVAEVEAWMNAIDPSMVKIRFDADKTTRDADIEGDIAKATAVRELVGDGFPLAFDSNNGYSVQGAIRVGRALEQLGYTWFEEPVQSYHKANFEKVASAIDVPVAAGEQEYTLAGVQALIDAGVGIIQADIVKTGGFTGLCHMAALTRAAGVDFVPHQTQPVIGHIANMHFVATLLHSHSPVEYSDRSGRQDEVFSNPPRPKGGRFALTDAPGLGLQINEAAFDACILGQS